MRDGTLVDLDEGHALDRIDLKEAFSHEAEVTVFLAIPKLKVGDQNVAKGAADSQTRFMEVNGTVQDENEGGNHQELQYRKLNARLLLSTQDAAGFEVLPLCRVRRIGVDEPSPTIAATYFPPSIAIDAWPPLQLGIVREIYDLIAAKIEILSEQLSYRDASLAGMDPADLEQLWMLSALNQAFTTLSVLTFAAGVHPVLAYTELCRIVGQLCFIDAERRPPEIPRYDHDDLATIFRYIKEKILLYLNRVVPPGYVRRDFVGAGLGMSVTLEPSWFGNDWQWFVGVLRQNIDEHECVALLKENGLNWKLGSATQVDELFRLGMEGLRLEPLARAPQPLPTRGGNWLYFQVSRGNAAWQDVLRTQTLAMRLRFSMIVNRNELQGQKRIVVPVKNKQVSLQFALFAVQVPKKTSSPEFSEAFEPLFLRVIDMLDRIEHRTAPPPSNARDELLLAYEKAERELGSPPGTGIGQEGHDLLDRRDDDRHPLGRPGLVEQQQAGNQAFQFERSLVLVLPGLPGGRQAHRQERPGGLLLVRRLRLSRPVCGYGKRVVEARSGYDETAGQPGGMGARDRRLDSACRPARSRGAGGKHRRRLSLGGAGHVGMVGVLRHCAGRDRRIARLLLRASASIG